MKDGLKESLAQINKLRWLNLSFAVGLLLFEPLEIKNYSILGIIISTNKLVFIAPLTILFLTITRNIIINNINEAVSHSISDSELKELFSSYPLLEFMRWKFNNNFLTAMLTLSQVVFDYIPSFIIMALPFILKVDGETYLIPLKPYLECLAVITILFELNNYTKLKLVYETYFGKIKTPD